MDEIKEGGVEDRRVKSIFVNIDRCVACKTCEITCALNRSSVARRFPEAIYEEVQAMPRVRVEPTGGEGGFPIQCRHCEDAPCLDACPSGALYRDEEGLVLVHAERCIGCWMCMMVCPFGAPQPFRHYRKVIKCDGCKGRDEPYCVESCPTHALVFMDSEEMARRETRAGGTVKLMGLGFVSGDGLSKALSSFSPVDKEPVSGKEQTSDERNP
jgi:carbon-monoxide dehydrogenase iron sulfur subunit